MVAAFVFLATAVFLGVAVDFFEAAFFVDATDASSTVVVTTRVRVAGFFDLAFVFVVFATDISQVKQLKKSARQTVKYYYTKLGSIRQAMIQYKHMLSTILLLGTGLASLISLIQLIRLDRNISLFKRRSLFSDASLLRSMPSVSVCIPARNEFKAMNECLELVLASRYPKLEVIVIDDESVDDTPQIVKTFAHEGVRFIAGGEIPDQWLGKNHALDVLLSEANGSYVLFMDVDTKLQPYTIGQFVSYMEQHQLTMMSALPHRHNIWHRHALFAPFRYFWRVMLHDKHHPVAASNAWMIRRKEFIAEVGGFEQFKAVVEPETELARVFLARQAYRFLISDEILGLTYEKRLSSQFETSIRLRYPALRFSWLRSLGAALLLMLYAVLPWGVLLLGLIAAAWQLIFAGAFLYLLEVFCYHIYLKTAWPERNIAGSFVVTLLLLEDAAVTVVSMVKYVRHTVTWKGRAITPQPSSYQTTTSPRSKS